MIHLRARRLLARLPDDTLPPQTQIEVRAHVACCARCRRQLYQIQLTEALLRRIPATIVPLESSLDAYVRLAALARWTDDPEIKADPEGWRLSLVSVASFVLVVCVAASAGSWAPTIRPGMAPGIDAGAIPQGYAYVASHHQ